MHTIYQHALAHGFEEAIAEEFGPYLEKTQGDKYRALELYAFNMRVSEALYNPLHILEVTLRNRFSTALSDGLGAEWFDHPSLPLPERSRKRLARAKEDVLSHCKEITPQTLSPLLPFAFWVDLTLSNELWGQVLHHRAIHPKHQTGLKRGIISNRLYTLVNLRNYIAHHLPVWQRDLPLYHDKILEATRLLSPIAAEWSECHSRFNEVWAQRPSFLTLKKKEEQIA